MDDMYDEGTPRDLVEQLVLNGLLSLADERSNKLFKQQASANNNSKIGSPTRWLHSKVGKDPDDDDVDVVDFNNKEPNASTNSNINNNNQNNIKELEAMNNLGQSLVDGRAAYATEVLSIIGTHSLNSFAGSLLTRFSYKQDRIKDSFVIKFNDEIRDIENKDILSSLNLLNIASLSPSIVVSTYTYQLDIGKNNTDNTTINSRVTSGGSAGGSNGRGDNSDLDSLSSAGITNNVVWKTYEDNSQTKADPSGSRKKPSVGVIDPPNNGNPPNKYADRDSNDNVIEDTRNNVDYGATIHLVFDI